MNATMLNELSGLFDKRVLITGRRGFIGASLANQLLIHGVLVDLKDRFEDGVSVVHEMGLVGRSGLRVINGDVMDRSVFSTLEQELDYVIHAAPVLGIN